MIHQPECPAPKEVEEMKFLVKLGHKDKTLIKIAEREYCICPLLESAYSRGFKDGEQNESS